MHLLTCLWQDFRFGARNLAKGRMFTAIALGSLALGIGGSTAMYSVIYAVILHPFIYKDAGRLMSVQVRSPEGRGNGSYYTVDQFLDLAERNTVFEGVIASTWSDVTWTGNGDPQRLRGNHCTMNTFDVMGVAPMIGRATMASDAADGAEPVTLLGYKFWQRQFGGDPSVLGRKLELNGTTRTVIGVMPRRFMWRGADVYLPTVYRRGETPEGVTDVHLMGRLKPGVTNAQADADLRPILLDLQQRQPKDFPKSWRIQLQNFAETFPSGIQDALWILFGAVGLLLVIACVNVSNLLLSRASFRRREIAIRASLGASRARLVGQLLAESLVLGVAGGVLGVVAAYAGLQGIIAMVPPNTIPDEAQIALNGSVLWFTLAVSVTAALLFGLAPALQFSGRDIVRPLKEAGRGSSGTAGQRVLRGILVVGEVALSLMLLVGASLMIRTLISIQGTDLGFHPGRVLTLRIPFSEQRYPDAKRRVAFLREVLRRVESVPGVVAATVTTGLHPLGSRGVPVEVAGGGEQDKRPALWFESSENYAKVLGIGLIHGRFLTEQEVYTGLHNAVVNESFVRRYLSGGEALGRMVRIPDAFTIVGVVKDRLNRIYTNETLPEIYTPYTINGRAGSIVLLAQGQPEQLEKAVLAQIYSVDRGQPVMDVKSLEAVLSENIYARPRFNLLLFAVFAALGLTLALSGVYGVISNSVAQQTREIGIRIAMGASLRQVVGMVLWAGAKLLGIGIAVGLAASLASVKVLSGLVRNVSTFDPYSFAGVAAALFAAGLFASYWPARRAARVDPVTALRDE
jgi:putative ABC transport system permease protein